jgi:peptide/nickel transport system substrate-binding protein
VTRRLLFLVLLLALAGAGCRARGPSPNLEGGARDVLVVACGIDAISLDPAVAYEFVSANIQDDLYDTLIRYDDNDFTKPVPHLAERWDVSPDGLRYVFHLRKDVHFASGAPLDALAVKYSFDRCLNMKMAPSELLSDNLAADRIRVIDPYTVEMRLLHPSSYFLSTLFNPAAAIVDPTVVAAHPPEWMLDHSAGSGPFVLASWDRDASIVLVRNENYWGKKPRLERVILKDVKESTTQQMLLEHGDVDMAYDLSPLEIEEALRDSPRVRVIEGPFLRLFYLGMNVKKKPFDDPRVRNAVRLAIDYDGLVRQMARGHALPLQGPIIKGLLGYAPNLRVERHDPEKARALLRAAGYASGFDTTLYASSGSTTFGPTRDEICTKLQADLAAVGIRAQLRMLTGTAYLELYRGKKTELNMGDWGADYPDPFNFAQPFGHSDGALAKRVEFGDPALDAMIDRAGAELDATRRAALYVKIQKRLMEEGPWAVLLQPTRVMPLRAEVHGYRYNAMSPMNYASVWKAEP